MLETSIYCFCFIAVFLQNIASRLSQIAPAFDSSRSANTSAACKIHTHQFIVALSRLELWAFQSNYHFFLIDNMRIWCCFMLDHVRSCRCKRTTYQCKEGHPKIHYFVEPNFWIEVWHVKMKQHHCAQERFCSDYSNPINLHFFHSVRCFSKNSIRNIERQYQPAWRFWWVFERESTEWRIQWQILFSIHSNDRARLFTEIG